MLCNICVFASPDGLCIKAQQQERVGTYGNAQFKSLMSVPPANGFSSGEGSVQFSWYCHDIHAFYNGGVDPPEISRFPTTSQWLSDTAILRFRQAFTTVFYKHLLYVGTGITCNLCSWAADV